MRDFMNIVNESLLNEDNLNEEIEVETIDGPEAWASYLINGDDSDMDPEEIELADKWVASLAPYSVVSADGESHITHSFSQYDPRFTSGSVISYTLHK
jgi:hypothetical protein